MSERTTVTTLAVADGLVVSLDYTLRLGDGAVVSSSKGRLPLEFLQGQGEIIAGLERALYGMRVGEEKIVVLPPTQGYGERDPDAFEVMPRSTFPQEMELEPGIGIRLRRNGGQKVQAFVAEIRDDAVVLDFNHPLAGETLHFHVRIAALRQQTQE